MYELNLIYRTDKRISIACDWGMDTDRVQDSLKNKSSE